MNDDTIIGIDEDNFFTLGEVKDFEFTYSDLDRLTKFRYDPMTGQKIYWDVIKKILNNHNLDENDLI